MATTASGKKQEMAKRDYYEVLGVGSGHAIPS
jgi:hypothetical protein